MQTCIGKTALVTSASGAVGRAVALALGAAGAQVLVHHYRSPAAAEHVVDNIRASGGRAKALAVDLSSIAGAHQLAHQARMIIGDRLDILVINAKLPRIVDLKDATPEVFDGGFAANVRAPLFLVQQLLPVMNAGSCLVFALAPSSAPPDDPASSAIQGGLEGLVSRLAILLKSRGIRFDAVIPVSSAGGAGHELVASRHGASAWPAGARPADIARAVTAFVTSGAIPPVRG